MAVSVKIQMPLEGRATEPPGTYDVRAICPTLATGTRYGRGNLAV